MPSNEQMVGHAWPATSFAFEERIGPAYADATDDGNPRYRGPNAVAPPMAIVTATIPHGLFPALCDEKLVVDLSRLMKLLHAEEDIRWHGVLKPGDVWSVQSRLVNIEVKSSGEILNMATTVTTRAGVVLAEAHSSMFIRERRSDVPRRDESAREPTPQVVPEHSASWTVAPDQSERYAAASGDNNPIHLDEQAAKAAGLKGRVLHGLCTMAFAQRAVIDDYGDGEPERLKRLRVRFVRPVYMGDTLTCDCREVEKSGERRVIELMVRNQDHHAVLTHGVAELVLR